MFSPGKWIGRILGNSSAYGSVSNDSNNQSNTPDQLDEN